jgi:hypothetical protein
MFSSRYKAHIGSRYESQGKACVTVFVTDISDVADLLKLLSSLFAPFIAHSEDLYRPPIVKCRYNDETYKF